MRSGAIAGVFAGSLLVLVESAASVSGMLAWGAPWYGYLLGPLLSWLVLVPVMTLAGMALSAAVRAWTGCSSAQLGERWELSWLEMRQGSLAWHGWLVGTTLVVGGILATGGGLQAALNDSFNNALLKGLLLTTILGFAALLWTACVRGVLRLINAAFDRLLPKRRYAPGLLLALVLFGIGASIAGAVLARNTLAAIGWFRVAWLAFLPLGLTGSWVGAIVLRRRLKLAGWKIALFVVAMLPLSILLGTVSVARQSVNGDAPTSIVMSLYQRATDFDRDGASMLFGGGDCAPFNRSIGPYAVDIPGNGIDENCIGGDASSTIRENTQAYKPLPKDFPVKPDIILITVDALRADHTGFLGYGRDTTPNLDRLVKSGVVFERAYSQASGTVGSLPSMFTSKYFDQVDYVDERFPRTIGPKENLLAERLARAGYATVGISSIRYNHKRRWGLLQGFEKLDLDLTHPDPAFKITSPQVLKKGLAALEARKDSKKPVFLWIHFYDVHTEYLKHKEQPSFGEERMDVYDGEILFTDRYVGKLLDAIFAERDRKQFVFLTADHGDGFKSDRGLMNHGYGLWNEQVHVPFVIWAPGARPGRIDTPVANLDVAATALNIAGVEAKDIMGHTLIPYLYEGVRDPDRIVFAIEPYREGAVWQERSVAIGMRWKLHRVKRNGRESLYDLNTDPGERVNVIGKQPEIARALGAELNDLAQDVDIYRFRNANAESSARPVKLLPVPSPAGSASARPVR